MSDQPNWAAVDSAMFETVDPTANLEGKPVPAMTSLLYRVCGNDERKFEEATRLVALFVRQALQARTAPPDRARLVAQILTDNGQPVTPPDQADLDDLELARWNVCVEIAAALGHPSSGWRPTSEAPEKPGTYVNVRAVTSYRWLAYKPEGVRQMKRLGRWQRATEHGWENAPLPPGEFIPTPKVDT